MNTICGEPAAFHNEEILTQSRGIDRAFSLLCDAIHELWDLQNQGYRATISIIKRDFFFLYTLFYSVIYRRLTHTATHETKNDGGDNGEKSARSHPIQRLVRMSSPVRIWVAAPTNLHTIDATGRKASGINPFRAFEGPKKLYFFHRCQGPVLRGLPDSNCVIRGR